MVGALLLLVRLLEGICPRKQTPAILKAPPSRSLGVSRSQELHQDPCSAAAAATDTVAETDTVRLQQVAVVI